MKTKCKQVEFRALFTQTSKEILVALMQEQVLDNVRSWFCLFCDSVLIWPT